MAFKIYTRTGDKGTTALFGGKRLPKSDLRIEAYGTVDELNSYLGLLRCHLPEGKEKEELLEVQHWLFVAGAHLATDPDKPMDLPSLPEDGVERLERAIDRMEAGLPPLKHFILPGGNEAVAHCHVARCVCRRAERRVVALAHDSAVDEGIVRLLNRLSDYLFVLARHVGRITGAEEIPWKP
ncbi:MAG: cob(I)yrinic acid a,c-diamide adenosyltransferase [Bacteroidetes bacterium]|nr:MAG: cob(I)yrinic acid a,c-diamide adenosyltransferase [Bacteroidota bacterium]